MAHIFVGGVKLCKLEMAHFLWVEQKCTQMSFLFNTFVLWCLLALRHCDGHCKASCALFSSARQCTPGCKIAKKETQGGLCLWFA